MTIFERGSSAVFAFAFVLATFTWMLLKLVTGNGERESGNECTAVTRLRIEHGGGNDVCEH